MFQLIDIPLYILYLHCKLLSLRYPISEGCKDFNLLFIGIKKINAWLFSAPSFRTIRGYICGFYHGQLPFSAVGLLAYHKKSLYEKE